MYDAALELIGSEPQPISNDEYRRRVDRLTSQMRPGDLLIVPASNTAVHSNDVHYPYRTQSDMLYLAGWDEPDAVFTVHHQEGKWFSTLFVQPKDTLKEIWEGRRPGTEGALANWPIDAAHSSHELQSHLQSMLSDATRVLLRTGIRSEIDQLVVNALERRDRARQHFGSGPITIEDPSARIAELRLRKSAAEIAQMRFASEVSSIAHVAAMRNTKPGRMEYQLQATIEGFFSYAGTSGWAYPSIVGCGDNATVLHYHQNNDVCEDGEVILIDAGAEYRGYAADITRSWPINGKFTDAQKEIYQLVLDAQLAAIDKCRVGLPYNAPHDEARLVLAQGLIDLGVINQTLEEALDSESGELKKWYMHNTGHWIGLDVHDVGVYKPNGEPRLLEEGMVMTVEPGLYFGAWRPDVDCPERYADLGVRIEDDVLVTSGNPDVLTSACPKTIDDIESITGQPF
ncbi:MAG: aminopeptidase P N-terminal domain-containing protein [Candidatus Poseidoniaceae archaeon]|nr:aminopeptidase P N-terminal domain-containing protein [Candidatus Poseidoniaceae archaeon]